MCCFSGSVDLVSDTEIFARGVNGRQVLVYSMTYAARADLAMVLPLPVPPDAREDDVTFVNLEHYPTFFDHLQRGFDSMRSQDDTFDCDSDDLPKLRVHEVGSFEASFVPRIVDFSRLDQRFQIATEVWSQLPAYKDYGFAVFKLRASLPGKPASARRKMPGATSVGRAPKPRRVHPMAFTFRRRNPDLLYFPTVHVHDGSVHSDAVFDHLLYCQPEGDMEPYLQGWERSVRKPSAFMDTTRAAEVLDPDQHCWRIPLTGRLRNRDAFVGHCGALPEPVEIHHDRTTQ
jgi:hypothetical protein